MSTFRRIEKASSSWPKNPRNGKRCSFSVLAIQAATANTSAAMILAVSWNRRLFLDQTNNFLFLNDPASILNDAPPIHEKNSTMFNTAARRSRAHMVSDNSNTDRVRTDPRVFIYCHIKSVSTLYVGRDISLTRSTAYWIPPTVFQNYEQQKVTGFYLHTCSNLNNNNNYYFSSLTC